jgi:hypothetical protein
MAVTQPVTARLATDEGKKLEVKDLVGWAEEHQAKW